MWATILLIGAVIAPLPIGTQGGYNVTQTIKELMDGYDSNLRPNFGGEPCYLSMDITIASFDAISDVNMDYTLTMYLNQYWKDERLAFSSEEDMITLPGDFADLIWVPDTFFPNDKDSYLHDVTEKNKMVRIHGDGSIIYGMRFTTTLACLMDLHYYPLDTQNCTMEIKSYGYTLTDVLMSWQDIPIVGVEEAEIPQFTISSYNTSNYTEKLTTGEYDRLRLTFHLSRNIGYFIFQTYFPCILIVVLSWVSFWINHEAPPARVALGITTVLTMTTISTGVRATMPKISYVKAIDIYLVVCFVFVFAALLEYAAVNYIFRTSKKKPPAPKKKKTPPPPKPPLLPQAPTKEGGSKTDGITTIPEEIIELQDIPAPSLRQRNNSKIFSGEGDTPKFSSPSFPANRSNLFGRSMSGISRKPPTRKQMIASLRKSASAIKANIPVVTDVNKIDKYSRVIFPTLYIIFNLCYWGFYYA